MDISVVNISKGPYEFNEEAIKEYNVNKLSFNITARIRYSTSADYVGFQIDLMILQDRTQIFKSGFLIGLAIVGWARDLQNGLDLNKNRDRLPELCKTAWLVATGIVALQSSTPHFNGIILPVINYEELSKEVLLIPNLSN